MEMSAKPDGRQAGQAPDAGRVAASEYPQRELPPVEGQRRPGFQVVARRSVLNNIYRHGHASPNREVCGILVGNVYRDEVGPLLYLEASIRGEYAGSQDTQVTFTPETWAYVQDEMDRHHADRRILGWYHTHPGFGIFLSGMDLFIQENFFSLPWQVAFVYDPVSGEEGVFVWREGAPVREAFLVEDDAMSEKRQGSVRREGETDALAVAERLQAVEKGQKWLLLGVAAVALLVLIWPIAWGGLGRPSGDDSARDWIHHFLQELGQLRKETREMRGEVRQLRLEVARLREECDRQLSPAPASFSPAEGALLASDLLPGPPRTLFTGISRALVEERRKAN
jgi:proteasome lid subunit RPN8/RPN11